MFNQRQLENFLKTFVNNFQVERFSQTTKTELKSKSEARKDREYYSCNKESLLQIIENSRKRLKIDKEKSEIKNRFFVKFGFC